MGGVPSARFPAMKNDIGEAVALSVRRVNARVPLRKNRCFLAGLWLLKAILEES